MKAIIMLTLPNPAAVLITSDELNDDRGRTIMGPTAYISLLFIDLSFCPCLSECKSSNKFTS